MTPSLLVSSLALTLAMGAGVGYAAGSLPKHSVGVKQLKKNAVTTKAIKVGAVTTDRLAPGAVTAQRLAPGAVTGTTVVDGSLTGADLAAGSVTGAQIDQNSLAIPNSTGTLVLSGEDFKARSYETQVQAIGDGGVYIATNADYLTADLPVPANATIVKVVVYFVDNGAGDVAVRVVRDSPSSGTMADLVTPVTTTGNSATIRSVSIPLHAPDDGISDRRLLVQPSLGTSYQVYGAVVSYTYTARLN